MNKNTILEELINNFDFEQVQDVMTALNWTWWSCNNKVPTVRQMEFCVIDLFNTVWDGLMSGEEDYMSATGGFEVCGYKTNDEEVPYGFSIKFILEESSNY